MSRAQKLGSLLEACAARPGAAQLLLALTLLLLPACIECFDGGALEAAHGEGEADALEVNDAEYARGYGEASLLTHGDGVADGDTDGYEAGYFDGYYGPAGYARGYDIGYGDGQGDGVLDPAACTVGASDGFVDGEADGHYVGWGEGYELGYDDGYGDGYLDGGSSCGFRSSPVEPDDVQVCHQRGYDLALDRSAFERGREAGKLDNPEYQAGYTSQYELVYAVGRSHGELDGYDAGLFDGYDDGYVDGSDHVYFACYDQAYPAGFEAGYGDGSLAGLSVGYEDGYFAGYADASSDC